MANENSRAFRIRPDMRRGLRTEVPLPTRLVSNEEFPPLPQTAAQRAVEDRILAAAGRLAPRLGLSRRDFLRTSGGVATSLLAMNAVFGRFFDVLPVEAADPAAFQERTGAPLFIFDVQVHYVGAGYDPGDAESLRKGAVSKQGLLGLRRQARRLNPKLASDRGTLADLSWENFVKEVFLDSETAIGLISTPPGPYPQEAVVPPKEMTHIRDEINRITQSRRMLAHGLITPQLGQADLDFMDLQAATLKVDAWKGYTGAPPKGFDRGWFVDDEKLAYPMLERARRLGVRRVCLHKGLPLGPVADYNHPRDLIKAAQDFPDIDFLAYHSGLLGVTAPKRLTTLPDVPAIAEAVPGYAADGWYGFAAPKGTPREICERINTLMRETMQDAAIVQRLNASLLEPVVETIAQSKAFIAAEVPKHVALLKKAGFEAQ